MAAAPHKPHIFPRERRLKLKKTCANCENFCTTLQDPASEFHIHYYCAVWRTIVPHTFLIDEYDAPMLEAYNYGFWNDAVSLFKELFNSTLKSNPYLHRAILTGVTRISKESLFSDLNNLKVQERQDRICSTVAIAIISISFS